jgi:hypothetical protein
MAETPSGRLNPAAIPVPEAARLLSAAGGTRIEPAALEADLAAGAPCNGDGTLNLVHYAAWLIREIGRGA